jgi:hypothetical protein
MKKYLFMAIMALVAFTSCQKDDNNDGSNTNTGSTSNTNSIIGEWKATKIVATFNDGSTWSTDDFEELSEQLEGLEWFIATENHLQLVSYAAENGQEILLPYSISDNHIVFTGAESDATYYLQSVTENEMIIKYVGKWTSLIYYTKVTKVKEEDESNDNNTSIIGEWKATKIAATFSNGTTWSTTNFEELSAQLEGLEWFIATEHHIQPKNHSGDYDREVLIPYSISNNYIVFTGAESNATYYLQSVTKDEMIIKYTKDWTSLIYYNKVKE